MHFYVLIRSKDVLAFCAPAVLDPQQRQQLFRIGLSGHLSLASCLPVDSERGVKRAVAPAYFNEPSNRGGIRFNQLIFPFVKCPVAVWFKVAGLDPLAGLVRMASFGPVPEHLPLAMSHFGKYFFSGAISVIHCPSPNDRVKVPNYRFGLFLLVGSQIVFDLAQMQQYLLSLGSGQQGAPVKPFDLKAQEVEPFINMYNAGFGFAQLQTSFLQKLHYAGFDIGFQYFPCRGCDHKIIGNDSS